MNTNAPHPYHSYPLLFSYREACRFVDVYQVPLADGTYCYAFNAGHEDLCLNCAQSGYETPALARVAGYGWLEDGYQYDSDCQAICA